jgi:hypothetical protein
MIMIPEPSSILNKPETETAESPRALEDSIDDVTGKSATSTETQAWNIFSFVSYLKQSKSRQENRQLTSYTRMSKSIAQSIT